MPQNFRKQCHHMPSQCSPAVGPAPAREVRKGLWHATHPQASMTHPKPVVVVAIDPPALAGARLCVRRQRLHCPLQLLQLALCLLAMPPGRPFMLCTLRPAGHCQAARVAPDCHCILVPAWVAGATLPRCRRRGSQYFLPACVAHLQAQATPFEGALQLALPAPGECTQPGSHRHALFCIWSALYCPSGLPHLSQQ